MHTRGYICGSLLFTHIILPSTVNTYRYTLNKVNGHFFVHSDSGVLFSREECSFLSFRDSAPLRVGSARTRSTGEIGSAHFVVCDRLKINFASVNSAKRRRPSSISRSTIPFRSGDTSRRSRGNLRRNADMRRRLRDTRRRGNAFVSRCLVLCLSIALIVSSARLVSGQRWVRVEAMLVSLPLSSR